MALLSYEALFSLDKDDESMDVPSLEATNTDPMVTIDEDMMVETAGRKLVTRQKAVIQEQRLHTLSQILGLTLHELNQPLTALLGNIELIGLYREQPEKLSEFLERIDEAGKRLYGVVKKMQDIRAEMHLPRFDLLHRQVSERPFNILTMIRSDDVYSDICQGMAENQGIALHRVEKADRVLPLLKSSTIDLMFIDDYFLESSGVRFVKDIKDRYKKLPLVVIADKARGPGFWFTLLDMAEEYLIRQQIEPKTLLRVIDSAMETVLLKNRHAFSLEKIAEISQRDPVTGLPQRRFFTDAVDREIIKAGRNETAFVIFKIGINNMNSIIKDHGKEDAACILSDTSAVLHRFAGENDTLCRYDNHSFVFIQLVETEADIDVIRKMLETVLNRQFKGCDAIMPSADIHIRTVFYSFQNPCTGHDLIKKMI
jgi:two-component system, cell cycle response regulator